ncbi:MAG: FlgO family outer membrane protein [Armatimonadetes bacterium]|nr:FlgO family outer membrane protein [Armatimonadota bacterium]
MRRQWLGRVLSAIVWLGGVCYGDEGSPRMRLAVTDFTISSPSALSGTYSTLGYHPGRTIAELLTAHIVKTGRFEVVERARLYQVLAERKIASGTALLGEEAKEFGSALGVQAIVVGSWAESAYGYEVAARIVSVADGTVAAAENMLIPAEPLWMDEATAWLARRLVAALVKERGYVLDCFPEPGKFPLLVLDLGTAQGAAEGRKVEIVSGGDAVVHPLTGEVLGTRDVPLATAIIVRAEKELSYARVDAPYGLRYVQVEEEPEGVDFGIERMNKARLLDEVVSTIPDPDLSVLRAKAQVTVVSDIPDSKLFVDGQPTDLQDGMTTVQLGAGTHLLELRTGNLGIPREVKITRKGADPPIVHFDKGDMERAVRLATPPLQPQPVGSVVESTVPPEATPEQKRADDQLVALLPSASQIQQMLSQAKEEEVVRAFETGLQKLRIGYSRNKRAYLVMARNCFRETVSIAPEFALGQFCLGLASYYLDELDLANSAFHAAAKLEPALAKQAPLLWWNDFRTLPSQDQLWGANVDKWKWSILEPDLLRYELGPDEPVWVTIKLFDADVPRWHPDNRIVVRYRLVSGDCTVTIGGRRPGTPNIEMNVGPDWCNLVEWHVPGEWTTLGHPVGPVGGPGWHIVELRTSGTSMRGYLDGQPVVHATTSNHGAGGGCSLTVGGIGVLLVDWVLVTRIHDEAG